jgi:hypothetical protein
VVVQVVLVGEHTEARAVDRRLALLDATQEDCRDGRYSAYLVELDDEGQYDTYLALAYEDIIWFYGTEHAPVS